MPSDAVTRLKVACDQAYDQYPDSCSHAVWSVIRAVLDPSREHQQANGMLDAFAAAWTEVDLDTAHALALKGTVVAGGLKNVPNGHVIVVYPADKIESGGYPYHYAKLNKTLTMGSHGKFPPCLSTSIGSWPGARSKGDKTVWDPWANDAVFAKVKFWTPKA